MTTVINILQVGGIGCLVFSTFILLLAYSGIAAEIRDEEGKFRGKHSVKAIAGGVIFLCFLFGILFVGNARYIALVGADPGWIHLWVNSFGVFFVIHLYDLLVLDFLIIVKWHPRFLDLPDTEYYRSFVPHWKGFLRGIPLGLGASLFVSLLNSMF